MVAQRLTQPQKASVILPSSAVLLCCYCPASKPCFPQRSSALRPGPGRSLMPQPSCGRRTLRHLVAPHLGFLTELGEARACLRGFWCFVLSAFAQAELCRIQRRLADAERRPGLRQRGPGEAQGHCRGGGGADGGSRLWQIRLLGCESGPGTEAAARSPAKEGLPLCFAHQHPVPRLSWTSESSGPCEGEQVGKGPGRGAAGELGCGKD